jgi:hypothetical protein
VFDLDETLIKTVIDPSIFPDSNYDVHLKLKDGNEMKEMYISIRPYTIEMLKRLKKHAELIVFTAG